MTYFENQDLFRKTGTHFKNEHTQDGINFEGSHITDLTIFLCHCEKILFFKMKKLIQ